MFVVVHLARLGGIEIENMVKFDFVLAVYEKFSQTWNSLPADIRSCNTLQTFKRHL